MQYAYLPTHFSILIVRWTPTTQCCCLWTAGTTLSNRWRRKEGACGFIKPHRASPSNSGRYGLLVVYAFISQHQAARGAATTKDPPQLTTKELWDYSIACLRMTRCIAARFSASIVLGRPLSVCALWSKYQNFVTSGNRLWIYNFVSLILKQCLIYKTIVVFRRETFMYFNLNSVMCDLSAFY